ncbi:hypothetical protein O3P69_003491 [Scylla paramamosain]|uniref:Uncharacterized protein n=1 Tax=Scylla paramamosain TaxID=85552 RepID=A0AAW0UJS9_SCYPA
MGWSVSSSSRTTVIRLSWDSYEYCSKTGSAGWEWRGVVLGDGGGVSGSGKGLQSTVDPFLRRVGRLVLTVDE